MHPDDATARGLTNGQRVRVWNDLGEVYLPLRVTDRVPPGVVSSSLVRFSEAFATIR
jgi:anaerobic selenocysteine-containing dehydrogenase